MTTQTSQPNGDGQMLRGAPALRAAARNALTAREPAEPVDSADQTEPTAPVEPPDPPAGWYQNVRLLTGPPQEGEPPGASATAEADREGCYPVPEVADIVEWASAEKERELGREPELGSVDAPPDADAEARPDRDEVASGAYVGSEIRPDQDGASGASAAYAGPESAAGAPARAANAEPGARSEWDGGASAAYAGTEASAFTAYAGSGVRSTRGVGDGDPVVGVGSEVGSEPDAGGSARAAYVDPQVGPEWDGGAVAAAGYAGSATRSERDEVASAAHEDVEARSEWAAKDSTSAAYVEPGERSEWDVEASAFTAYASSKAGASASTGYTSSETCSEPDVGGYDPAADVEPQDRPARERDGSAGYVVGSEGPSGRDEAGSAPAAHVEPQDRPAAEAQEAAGVDTHPGDEPRPSGIPAPVWDVSVPAGSGGAVPARASVTFDTHRWSPLIVGEATHEIPVHLLFRDDEATGPVAGRPRARRAPVVSAPVLPPAASSRPATPVDTKLVERPGPTLPGWTAALVGVGGLFGCAVVLWLVGAVPDALTEMFGLASNPYNGIGIGMWALLTVAVTLTLFAFGGLGRGRVGHAWVLTLFGEYRGSVRRTGLLWVSPLLLRRRVDVRLRHWRSEPMPAVDANGTALRVVVLVVWRVRDTVRAALGVRDHEEYLREQVEAAMARVLSQLPADAFHEAAPTLRNAEVVGEALTRMLSAECRPVGLDVFSAQPTRIEYAPEISAAMQRSRIAAIDARHRDTVLTSVVDAVDDTVHRLTSRGLVELDDYERKVLVKDLTVAFYTGRHGLNEGN